MEKLHIKGVPKGLRSALPIRAEAYKGSLPEKVTKTALRGLAKSQLQEELKAHQLDADGTKAALVDRLHAALRPQPQAGASAQGASATLAAKTARINPELTRLRSQVASLDSELEAVQQMLTDVQAVRIAEREQLVALQGEMTDMRAAWEADRAALEDAMEASSVVAESEEEVQALQAQTVQLGERVVRLQTLVKEKDEAIAELKQKLREAKPQFAMAGAAAGPTMEEIMAGWGSGGLTMAPAAGITGSMWDIATSAEASPASYPISDENGKPVFRSDILQQPGVPGLALAAGSMAAFGAGSFVYSALRRLLPAEQRGTFDMASATTVAGVAAAAAFMLSQHA